MLKKAISNVFLVSLLSTSSLYAGSGAKVTFQLLVEDQDIEKVRCVTHTQYLPGSHSIAHPHVSFIQIEDKENILRQNFGEVMELATTILEKYRVILKAESKELAFLGQGVKGYDSQVTGQTYWCLEDADKHSDNPKPNKIFKFVAGEVKSALEKFIIEKSQENESFPMKTPGQIVQGMAEQTREAAQSYVEFSKGFPHVSIAKGRDLNSERFSEIKDVPIPLTITGINAVYTYEGSTSDSPIPQIYIKKYFGHPGIELTSQFTCLRDYNGFYPNIQSLLGQIEGLNSSYIRNEIQHILNQKKQRIETKSTTGQSDSIESLKEKKEGLQREIERLQRFLEEKKSCMMDEPNSSKRKREDGVQ